MLYRDDLLPENTFFLGYARSKLDIKDYLTKTIYENMDIKPEEKQKFDRFVEKNYYLAGTYDKVESFKELNTKILNVSNASNEKDKELTGCNRFFYLALPPYIYSSVIELLGTTCKASPGNFTRLIVEKPFGKDLENAQELSKHVSNFFTEDETYRIDHYIGEEMVQSLFAIRFANLVFSNVWNRDAIDWVMIKFKENIDIEGRGEFFDEYGIIRDVMQNHVLQIMSFVAMEAPASFNCPDDIRNEKVRFSF